MGPDFYRELKKIWFRMGLVALRRTIVRLHIVVSAALLNLQLQLFGRSRRFPKKP